MYTDWLKQVIDEALRHRNVKADEEEKGQFVLIKDDILREL